jgi:signal transduction histidine kinase
VAVPKGLSGVALVLAGRYYVQADGPILRGVRVDLHRMLAHITGRMRHLGLLTGRDQVIARPPSRGAQPVAGLALKVESPRWKRLHRDISRRYRLKTLLTVASGMLALVIVILAVVFQHRRHRYLQLKSDFVASVSHELRTPLASIRLLAETLERRTAGLEKVREYPARIVRDVDGLTFLVENILSFNRLDKGRWVIRPRTLALDELVQTLEEELETATAAEVQVRDEGLEGVTLRGDPELVRLLLSNLGRNGCLYNNQDPVVLTFGAARRADRLVVTVADNGVGIPAGERDKVFGEFYRPTDPTGRGVRGSGLGLAMCRRIMKLHGGTIRIAATGPDGTTFELDFPGRS